MSSADLVSVIIPCFQQARYLAEAVMSVLNQGYSNHEIIVVDDGSSDDTDKVAAQFVQVRYFRQGNRGSASARNRGVRESRGKYLVFLDADDRLLPHALATGVAALATRPKCAMTFGACKRIDSSGNELPTIRRRLSSEDYYLTLLRRCYISNPGSVLCRRSVFDAGVRFDEALPMCSDYEFYLQVARHWPLYCHNEVVCEYRQHGRQQSVNKRRVVDHIVRILEAQEPFTRESRAYRRMRRKGIRIIRHSYSHNLFEQAWKNLAEEHWQDALENFLTFLAYEPPLAGRIFPQVLLRTCRLWWRGRRWPST